jgi:LacI family transcriptional regulator
MIVPAFEIGIAHQPVSCRMSKVTLKHVAENVGVSVNTVSMVLQGRAKDGRISPARERQITEAARRLRYLPNAAARAARTGRFGNVGLVLSTEGERSFFDQPMLAAILNELQAVDMHLLVSRLPDTRLSDPAYLPRITRELTVDGLILNYTHGAPAALDDLTRHHHIPAIWLNNLREADCVYVDDQTIAEAWTRELIAMGHRRLDYADVNVSVEEMSQVHRSRIQREAGYRRAMQDAGLEPRVIRPATRTLGAAKGDLLLRHLQGTDRPSAILTYSSGNAEYALLAAVRLGLRVPEDLSVAAFDSSPGFFDGRSVGHAQIPDHHLGREAVRLLLRKLENPGQPLPPLAVTEPAFHPGDTLARLV